MNEYLQVLAPLLRGETNDYDDEQYAVHGISVGAAGAFDRTFDFLASL